MSYPTLASSWSAGSLRLPNRLVMPPMVVWKADRDGTVSQAILDHYSESLGAGLIVLEASVVSPEGRLARNQIGIFEDRHIDGLSRIAAIIHDAGSAAAIQIHHAGRQTTLRNTFGLPLLAPSAVPSAPGADLPAELTEQEIERIIGCFVQAAARAAEAGFDAIELHAAHGYLASQFHSPLANHRQDRWGGSLENRARFLREVVRRTRASVGDRIAVTCRLGAADGDAGGLTLEEGIQIARWLREDGVSLLHISSGIGAPPHLASEGSLYSDRMQLAFAVKKAVNVPVIGVGDVRHAALAEQILAASLVDLVAVGRGQLADPQWAVKSLAGRESEISVCRNCRVCHHFGHSERCPARKALAAAAAG